VTGVLWVVWIAAEWAVLNPDIPTGMGTSVLALFLRMASVAATLAVILAWLLTPMLATTKIWYELGKRAEQEQCSCGLVEGARVNADVIPIRRGRS
jgi:hypothetical protein